MSNFRNPVGPLPSSVYWRRRLIVGAGALAVLIIIILLFVRPGSGSEGAEDEKPADGPGEVVPEQPATDEVAACLPADISVTALTDAASYASGVKPQLQMRITNNGAKECELNAGNSQQEFLITSGNDRIWNSRDCQTDPKDVSIRLAPGASEETDAFGWERERSSVSTCASSTRTAALPGWYHLKVSLGAVESESTKQFELK